jgi:hypothetical protein
MWQRRLLRWSSALLGADDADCRIQRDRRPRPLVDRLPGPTGVTA